MSVAVGSGLDAAVQALTSADVFAFDTETSGLDPYRHILKGCSLSVGSAPDQTWWFPFRGDGALSQVQVFRALAPILGDPQKTLVGSDVKFDLKFMALHAPDVPVRSRLADTVVADWLVNENRQRHGLKPLAKELLGVQMVTYKEAALHDGGLFPEAFADYAKEDARRVLEVWRVLEPLLEQDGLTKLFHDVEMQIVRALVEMELTGVAIDLAFLKEYQGRMEAQRDAAAAEIQKVVGHPVDLASPEKVSRLLFEELRIPPVAGMEKGKAGYYSTNDDILTRLEHPVVAQALKWRHAAHALKTYCVPYTVRTKGEPRIRAEFKQPGTVAGRFTSEGPNLQQVAPEVKPLFIASPGMRLICGDFNQLQFRIVGHFAQRLLVDKGRIARSVVAEAYRSGMDLHTKTQQELAFKDRKTAKCVTGDTLILTDAGMLRIDEIVDAVAPGEVRPFAGSLAVVADLGTRPITEVYYGGRQPVYRLEGRHGFAVTATANHRFVVLRDGAPTRIPLRDLHPGDSVLLKIGAGACGNDVDLPRISLPPRTSWKPVETPWSLTPEAARWLGYYVAEGSRGHYGTGYVVVIGMNAGDAVDDVQRCWESVAPGRVSRNEYGIVVYLKCHSRDFYEWVGALGCGDGADHKRVPDVIRRAPMQYQREFLRGLFEGDGSVTVDPNRCVSLASNSSELISVVHQMLLNLGVLARRDTTGIAHRLSMSGREAAAFDASIGFASVEKNERLGRITASRKSTRFYPIGEGSLRRLLDDASGDTKERVRHCLKGTGFGETLLGEIPRELWTDEMRWAEASGVVGEEVVSVEYVGEQDVFDVVAPPEKLFVTNGFLTEDTVNFAFIFGRGHRSFGEATRKSAEEAERYYNGFHETYPEVRMLADLCRQQICAHGFVQSIAGRRRRFPELKGMNVRDKKVFWPGWVAWNAVVQGAEADIVRITMRNLYRALEQRRAEDVRWREARLLIQVHDELVMEAPEAIVDEVAALMKSCGESAVKLEVPVIMEVSSGRSWKDAKH